jgi:hypothetical protein
VAQNGLLFGNAALTWSSRCFHSCLRPIHDHWRPGGPHAGNVEPCISIFTV